MEVYRNTVHLKIVLMRSESTTQHTIKAQEVSTPVIHKKHRRSKVYVFCSQTVMICKWHTCIPLTEYCTLNSELLIFR